MIFPPLQSFYIHWPFCPYKCHFCPFVAIASHDQFMERYQDALLKEIQNFVASYPSKIALDTIFLGGGTPSTWPENLLLDTFATLRKIVTFNQPCEITIEVNPGTVTASKLALWKTIGINRLSIGVQSLKDSVLNTLNRKQSKDDVLWLISAAHDLFDNISIDLILGLPGVSEEEWKELLKTIVTWPITHVSIYFLTVHEETPLYYRVQKKEIMLAADEPLVDLYEWSVAFLHEHGLHQYEISNFARDGYQSQHNTVYWERKPYKGFGLGACSFDGVSRSQNQKNLHKYLAHVAQGADITIFSETLTEEQIYLERLMLGLRRAQGIALADIMHNFSGERRQNIEQTLMMLESNNFLQKKQDRVVLTAAGLAVQNDIAARLSL